MKPKPAPTAMPAPTRPSRHTAAKWIVGIFCFLAVAVTLALAGVVRLTERQTTIDTFSNVATTAFSQSGPDSQSDVEGLRQLARQEPGPTLKPFPLVDISISKQDALTLPPRELRVKVFSAVAAKLYDQGPSAIAGLTVDPAQPQKPADTGPAELLTAAQHKKFVDWFTISLVISSILLALLIFFSYRLGRMVSPGVILVLTGLPAAPLFFLSQIKPDPNAPAEVMPDILRIIGVQWGPAYQIAFAAGLLLLIAAGIARLIIGKIGQPHIKP